MNRNKNPHIQMPESYMRSFSHKTQEGKKVYALDLKNKNISAEKIRKLGTGAAGYYPTYLEDFFATIETKFGEERKKMYMFGEGKEKCWSYVITKEVRQAIFSFMDNMLNRSDSYVKWYNSGSVFRDIMQCSKSGFIGLLLESNAPNFFSDHLSKTHEINLLVNRTSRGFVAPRNCFYTYKLGQSGEHGFIMPISPKTAIILLPKAEMEKYIFDGKLSYGEVYDSEEILCLNRLALQTEKDMDCDFLIAKKKEDIKELIEFI